MAARVLATALDKEIIAGYVAKEEELAVIKPFECEGHADWTQNNGGSEKTGEILLKFKIGQSAMV